MATGNSMSARTSFPSIFLHRCAGVAPGASKNSIQSTVRSCGTPLEAATRHIESVLAILDDWDDWITDMGGDEDEDGREDLAKIRRMKCHLRQL